MSGSPGELVEPGDSAQPARPGEPVDSQAAALAWAVTGERIDLPDADPEALVAALAGAGWPPERVRDHARSVLDAGGAWPHPVDAGVLAGLGAARHVAALADLRQRLGVWTIDARPPTRRTRLDADELRLLAEAPPHHVG